MAARGITARRHESSLLIMMECYRRPDGGVKNIDSRSHDHESLEIFLYEPGLSSGGVSNREGRVQAFVRIVLGAVQPTRLRIPIDLAGLLDI